VIMRFLSFPLARVTASAISFTVFSSAKGDITINRGDGLVMAKARCAPWLLAICFVRATPSGPDLDYELPTGTDTKLALFVIERAPGRMVHGRRVVAMDGGLRFSASLFTPDKLPAIHKAGNAAVGEM